MYFYNGLLLTTGSWIEGGVGEGGRGRTKEREVGERENEREREVEEVGEREREKCWGVLKNQLIGLRTLLRYGKSAYMEL